MGPPGNLTRPAVRCHTIKTRFTGNVTSCFRNLLVQHILCKSARGSVERYCAARIYADIFRGNYWYMKITRRRERQELCIPLAYVNANKSVHCPRAYTHTHTHRVRKCDRLFFQPLVFPWRFVSRAMPATIPTYVDLFHRSLASRYFLILLDINFSANEI